MPLFNDLDLIKKKIQKIGNEKEILENENQPFNDIEIPDEISKEDIDKEIPEEDILLVDDDEEKKVSLDDIIEGFDQDKKEESDEIIDYLSEEEGSIEDSMDLDSVIDNIDGQEEKMETTESAEESADFDSILDNLQDETGKTEIDTSDLDSILSGGEGYEEKEEMDTSDIESLLSGDEELAEEKIESGIEDMDSLLSEEEYTEESTGEQLEGMDELESLMGESADQKKADEFISDEIGLEGLEDTGFGTEEETSETSMKVDDALMDLAGDFGEEKFEEEVSKEGEDVNAFLDQISAGSESAEEIKDIDSLISEETPSDEQEIEKESDEQIFDVEEEKTQEPFGEVEGEEYEEDEGFDQLEDLSSLGMEAVETDLDSVLAEEEKGDEELESFDLESIGSISEEVTTPYEEKISELAEEEQPLKGIGEIPEELSEEDIKKDNDIEIKLSDEERKQIIITLTSLPKEAEVKISKLIASGKYSNLQLKPLINALIDKDSPSIIIKLYEKITGDKSLAHISSVKYTGVKFEERRKSLSYLFQKNVMPILMILTGSIMVMLLGALLFLRVIKPTWDAGSLYKKGYKYLLEKSYDEANRNFDLAYEIQPRFKETVKFAREFRRQKQRLNAEKKYKLAVDMKSGNIPIMLEFADFYREIKNYESAELKYKELLISDNKNIDAMLGLAKTYFDWSDDVHNKINDAEQVYLDILDIDPNNKEAVYGKLNIYLKEQNYKKIMSHYKYIEQKFGKKIDPVVYANLAKYLIDKKEIENVKDILDKASRSLKKNQILPEIQYQYARYNKVLNVYDEERKYLERALDQMEVLKKKQNGFVDNNYSKLLSRIYNDLGESYERTEKNSIKAEEYYNLSIQMDPDYGKPCYNIANFAFNYKKHDEGYLFAKKYYEEAERRGFTNDRLNYNLGILYYKEKNYTDSYRRINKILDKYPNNANLKYFVGTIYYKMGNYDLSVSRLLEAYMYFFDMEKKYEPLEIDIKEDNLIMRMMKIVSNNLGAAYQKKYETTGYQNFLTTSTKYYSDSINYFDMLGERPEESETTIEMEEEDVIKLRKDPAQINLRMVLYLDAPKTDPIIYEDFPLDYDINL